MQPFVITYSISFGYRPELIKKSTNIAFMFIVFFVAFNGYNYLWQKYWKKTLNNLEKREKTISDTRTFFAGIKKHFTYECAFVNLRQHGSQFCKRCISAIWVCITGVWGGGHGAIALPLRMLKIAIRQRRGLFLWLQRIKVAIKSE